MGMVMVAWQLWVTSQDLWIERMVSIGGDVRTRQMLMAGGKVAASELGRSSE